MTKNLLLYSIFKYQFSFHFYLVARSLSRNKSVIPSVFNKTTVSLSGLFKWRSGAEESILSFSPFWHLNQMTEVKV
ncbi:unnamed protein product [Rhizophagus irregularis]|nr:unnamed protein product [Rhizophagus irregularis]